MASAAVNTSGTPTTDPFRLAVSEFLKKLPDEEQALCRQATGLEALLQDVAKLDEEDRAQSKSRRFMEKLRPTVSCLEAFGKSLDVLSNANPEAFCVLWGGMRIILQLATSFLDYFEKTLRMFTQIGDCLHRFQTYARLYPHSQHLSDALVRSYGHILEFVWDCRSFFLQAKRDKTSVSGHFSFLKKVWSTLKTQRDSICDRIREDTDLVEREASVIEKEEAQIERQAQRTERRAQQERWNDTELFHKNFRESAKGDEIDKIASWLSAPDPSTNHDNACRKRQNGTGSWFVDGPEFARWKTEPGSLLWLYGTAGCGKTILCSNIIEDILKHCQSVPESQCTYFYFDFRDQGKQTHRNLITSLLSQLLIAKGGSQTIHELYTRKGQGRQQPHVIELEEAFQSVIKNMPKTYLILDALDECTDREALLPFVQCLVEQAMGSLNVLVLSRREEDIEHALRPVSKHQVRIESSLVSSDIRLHVEDRLKSDFRFLKWPPELRNEVSQILIQKAHGMFQWVACQLSELQKCTTPRAVRDAVASMPRTLDDTYERMLLRIPDIYARDTSRIFQWMVYSARPLMVEEVSEILAFDPDRNPPLDAQRRLFDPKQLLSILSNLAILSTIPDWRASWPGSKTIEVVTFSHYSVQEYLCSERVVTGRVCQFSVTQKPATYSIAKSCLMYILQFDQADSLTPETYEMYPLARYAAPYWAKHARQYEQDEQSQCNLQPLIEQVFDDGNHAFLNWQHLYDPLNDLSRGYSELLPRKYTPLLCASTLGLVGTVVNLLGDEKNINSLRPDEDSPLVTAAARGHSEIVQYLIESGANMEFQSSMGDQGMASLGDTFMTPLGASARFGYEVVLSILLENGADVNTVMRGSSFFDLDDITALFWACEAGHVKIARMLIEKGALLDCQNGHRETTLMLASGPYPKMEIFKLLLHAGANVNISSRDGTTALSNAVVGLCSEVSDTENTGCMQIMQALLEKKANPNVVVKDSRDRRFGEVDRSVLHEVVDVGNLAVTRLLLGNGADVNRTDKIGVTPLMIAANNNHQSIAQLLLDNGADVKATFSAKGTAISLAAAAGHESIVQLLIDHTHLTGSVAERWTTSARLTHAIQDKKDLEVTKLLSEGADPTLTDLAMRNSLHLAADCGHESIVLVLLEHNSDIEATAFGDVFEMTALDIAVSQGHENIVQRLLDRGARTEPKPTLLMGQHKRRSPILTACKVGNENIVRMLLNHGADISWDNSNNNGLLRAAANGHHSVVKLLLERFPNLLRPAAPLGQPHLLETPLKLAAERGHEETVRVLLDKGVEVDYIHRHGDTALYSAAVEGREGTVRLLLEAGADPSTKLESGATPLITAISKGHTGVARILREYLRR